MSSKYERRPSDVEVLKAKQYFYGRWRNEVGFPVITDVHSTPSTPSHGTYLTRAGTIVVANGEWIAANGVGGYAKYGELEFSSKYTPSA